MVIGGNNFLNTLNHEQQEQSYTYLQWVSLEKLCHSQEKNGTGKTRTYEILSKMQQAYSS